MKFAVPAALALVLAFAASGVVAKTLTPQQQKMSTCSKDAHAKGLKGKDYKSFMSSCLKGGSSMPAKHAAHKTAAHKTAAQKTAAHKTAATHKSAAHKATTHSKRTAQRQKMRDCNLQAKMKKLKGAARKSFMSKCLKG